MAHLPDFRRTSFLEINVFNFDLSTPTTVLHRYLDTIRADLATFRTLLVNFEAEVTSGTFDIKTFHNRHTYLSVSDQLPDIEDIRAAIVDVIGRLERMQGMVKNNIKEAEYEAAVKAGPWC